MKYSVEQKVFLYDSYIKYSSYRKCFRKFRQKYPDFTVPCKSTIYRIVQNVQRTGTVLNKIKKRRRHVLTEEMLDDIGAQLEANPNIPLRMLAIQCGVSTGTAHAARILLNKPTPWKKRLRSNIDAECSNDDSISVDFMKDERDMQSELPPMTSAGDTDSKEQLQ